MLRGPREVAPRTEVGGLRAVGGGEVLGMAPANTYCSPLVALRVAAASGDLSQEFAASHHKWYLPPRMKIYQGSFQSSLPCTVGPQTDMGIWDEVSVLQAAPGVK
jgi:hypothetical protein